MKIQFTQEAWKDFEWFLDKDKRTLCLRADDGSLSRFERGSLRPMRLR